MSEIGRDIRHAARRLLAAPSFALFSVLTLAITIGVTTGIYAVIRAFMGPPPGVAEPERIAAIHHHPEGSGPIVSLSWPDFQDLRARQTSFDRVMGWRAFPQPVVGGRHSETVRGEIVTSGYFEVLGVRAAHGRTLQDADDQPGAPPVAVISYALWQHMFGGAPDVLRQTVRISGVVFDVVGVAPRVFQGSFNGGLVPTGFWVPTSAGRLLPTTGSGLDFDPNARSRRWVSVRGKLAPGRTLAEASSEVARIGRQLDAAVPLPPVEARGRPAPWDTRESWGARPLVGRMLGVPTVVQRGISTGLIVMLVLVLMVACTNLTNLTLARWSRRRGELAIRGALGGTRVRLIRELSLESALLAAAGGGLGVLLAYLITGAIARTPVEVGNGYLLVEPRIDLAVLLAVVLAVTAALFVSGIAPGVRVTKTDLRSMLANDNSVASPRWRGRRYLVTLQVATSAVLWILAVSSVQHFRETLAIDTGLDLDQLTVVEIDFAQQQYDEARVRQLVGALVNQLSRHRDAEAVAVSSGLPIGLGTPGAVVSVPGLRPVLVELMASTPEIFETLGVSIVHGRGVNARDAAGAEPVVVLSESTARMLFDTTNVAGRQVQFQRRRWVGEGDHPVKTLTVVGVAADTDAGGAGRRDHGTAFLPFAQHYEGELVISVRTPAVERMVSDVRRAVTGVDPQIAVSRIGTGTALAGSSLPFLRITMTLFGTLGAFTLLLALTGLSGVLSQIVAGRRREIGVRMALGADAARVRRSIVHEGMSPVLLGLVLGLGLGAIGRLALQPMVGRLMPGIDGGVLVFVAILFGAVGLAVCYLPARRASAVDPSVSLRHQ